MVESSDKEISSSDLIQKYTVKFYPYLQKKLETYSTKLDNILFDNFKRNEVYDSLFGKYRGKFLGFNHSLMLEFFIHLFDVLDNDIDREKFLIPQMREFLNRKKAVKVIENSREKNGKKGK